MMKSQSTQITNTVWKSAEDTDDNVAQLMTIVIVCMHWNEGKLSELSDNDTQRNLIFFITALFESLSALCAYHLY